MLRAHFGRGPTAAVVPEVVLRSCTQLQQVREVSRSAHLFGGQVRKLRDVNHSCEASGAKPHRRVSHMPPSHFHVSARINWGFLSYKETITCGYPSCDNLTPTPTGPTASVIRQPLSSASSHCSSLCQASFLYLATSHIGLVAARRSSVGAGLLRLASVSPKRVAEADGGFLAPLCEGAGAPPPWWPALRNRCLTYTFNDDNSGTEVKSGNRFGARFVNRWEVPGVLHMESGSYRARCRPKGAQ